jgi:hypothetical protein
MCFIDFRDTGRGPVFEDFVVFESSIRLQYRANTDLEGLIQREKSLIETGDDTSSLWAIVGEIRQLAWNNFPMEKRFNYIYGLAVFSFRLLRFSDLESWQKDQVVACLLACLEWLNKSVALS